MVWLSYFLTVFPVPLGLALARLEPRAKVTVAQVTFAGYVIAGTFCRGTLKAHSWAWGASDKSGTAFGAFVDVEVTVKLANVSSR